MLQKEIIFPFAYRSDPFYILPEFRVDIITNKSIWVFEGKRYTKVFNSTALRNEPDLLYSMKTVGWFPYDSLVFKKCDGGHCIQIIGSGHTSKPQRRSTKLILSKRAYLIED